MTKSREKQFNGTNKYRMMMTCNDNDFDEMYIGVFNPLPHVVEILITSHFVNEVITSC